MSVQYSPLSTVPGYTYTRSGAKSELSSTGSSLIAFAANDPGVVPSVGYWSRGAVTNRLTYSQDFTNAAWEVVSSGGTLTRTANAAVAPDGTTTADRLVITTAGGVYNFIRQIGASTASVKSTANLWIKSANGANQTSGLSVAGNVLRTGRTCNVTTAWQRFPLLHDGTTDAGNQILEIGVLNGLGVGTFDNNIDVHIWQGELYPGVSFADGGPIIATTTAAATVGADVLDVTASLPAGDFIVWVVADLKDATAATQHILVDMNNGTTNERILIYRNGASGPYLYVAVGGVAVFSNVSGSGQLAGRMAVLMRYSAGKYKFVSRNLGTGVESSTAGEVTAALPSGINRAQIGHAFSGTQLNGLIEGVYQRNGTFTDAEISSILAAS